MELCCENEGGWGAILWSPCSVVTVNTKYTFILPTPAGFPFGRLHVTRDETVTFHESPKSVAGGD